MHGVPGQPPLQQLCSTAAQAVLLNIGKLQPKARALLATASDQQLDLHLSCYLPFARRRVLRAAAAHTNPPSRHPPPRPAHERAPWAARHAALGRSSHRHRRNAP
jgi:hypothetical protein